MKLSLILSGLLAMLLAGLLISGILFNDTRSEQAEIIIEAPQSVVFNTLLDWKNYNQWSTLSTAKNSDVQNATRLAVYSIVAQPVRVYEKFRADQKENTFVFSEQDSLTRSFFRHFTNRIRLKTLADGTCEVFWQTSYSLPTVGGNLLSLLFFRPALRQALVKNLQALKRFIEH